MRKVRWVSVGKGGHQDDLNALMSAIFRENGLGLALDAPAPSPAFYATIDLRIADFVGNAFLNSVFRRRKTAGLLMRPQSCFPHNGVKGAIKGAIFDVARRMPNVEIISIVPFSVDERIARYCSSWIYDIQFWDLDYIRTGQASAPPLDFINAIARKAAGRKVVVALGRQDRDKGFDYFAEIWSSSLTIREHYLFVSAGKIASECAGAAAEFEAAGGLAIDRHISNAELFGLYDLTDLVWSCYPPTYDQSSGVFGRAFQLGRAAIVRESSVLEKLAADLRHPVTAIPHGNVADAARRIAEWTPVEIDIDARANLIRDIRQEALSTIFAALDLEVVSHIEKGDALRERAP